MRSTLMTRINALRDSMAAEGFDVGGTPSPIVPVFVGAESEARMTARQLVSHKLLANLVEFPAVPKGKSRFRFQVMRLHTEEETIKASKIMRAAYDEAIQMIESRKFE